MNVLIIGLGSIAKKHIDALHAHSISFNIYALRSKPNSEIYLDVKNIYSLEEAQEMDFAIISSPTSKHLENIQRLIELNIPLFIEKPLYHKLDIEDVIPEIKSKGIKTYVACNLRFLESLNYVKQEFLNNKELLVNEVNAYCGSYLPNWRPQSNYKEGYSANKELGGGAHLDLIHELDYLYWMFGAPIQTSKLLKSSSSLNIEAVDYANYNLEYHNFVANVVLNYYRREPLRYLEIVFNKFTIKVNIIENSVYKNGELIYNSDQGLLDTYKNQLEYFISNISGETFNDINEAYEVLKICL